VIISGSGFATEVRVTSTTSEDNVLQVKGRLCRSLADCSDEELLVIDAELISRKAGQLQPSP
jgi:superfamily II DNA or RNA helicase